jgi:KaiC/GvpD/RAD55 family RecA-like ATPase
MAISSPAAREQTSRTGSRSHWIARGTKHSVAHGVTRLEELTPEYGAERRRLRVLKYRGQPFRGGYHDFTIKTGGVEVFPRLVAAEHRIRKVERVLSTGIEQLDELVGGGYLTWRTAAIGCNSSAHQLPWPLNRQRALTCHRDQLR